MLINNAASMLSFWTIQLKEKREKETEHSSSTDAELGSILEHLFEISTAQCFFFKTIYSKLLLDIEKKSEVMSLSTKHRLL